VGQELARVVVYDLHLLQLVIVGRTLAIATYNLHSEILVLLSLAITQMKPVGNDS